MFTTQFAALEQVVDGLFEVKFLLATCVVEKNVEALLGGLPLHGFNLGGNLDPRHKRII